MGWVLMSERELNRIEVLSQVSEGRMTVAESVRSSSVVAACDARSFFPLNM